MKTLQKFGLEATPEAIDAFEGISAAEMLTAARGLAAMSAHHGTNRDSWVRVSQALAAMAWTKELAEMGVAAQPGGVCAARERLGVSPLGNTGTTTVGNAR